MDRECIIQFTQNLYRLTLLFPKKEPLRYKMRGVADNILANFISLLESNPIDISTSKTLLKDLKILDGFFEVAKVQNWVSPTDVLKVKGEYDKVKSEIEKISTKSIRRKITKEIVEVKPTPTEIKEKAVKISLEKNDVMSARQKKILEILEEKGKIQVWQAKQVFPQVSKRTIRRDFENLFKKGIIERMGEKNDTFYQLA